MRSELDRRKYYVGGTNMNDLTFFTNEQGQTLSDRFKKIIKNYK